MIKNSANDPFLSAEDLSNLKHIKSATRSILRYPGSKARLAKVIAHTLLLNGLNHSIFVEPFCGGSSISISLLESNIVNKVVLNDLDPLLASLWKCVFSREDAIWLAMAVMEVPLTLDYWHYQKNLEPSNDREAALKCLYLNRTSFSGILHQSAGPIGGKSQSRWSIGCRFNRARLSSRISELSILSNRVISVTNDTWEHVCVNWHTNKNSIFYFDPPFYNKAKRLYRFSFNEVDHQNLQNYLMTLESPWLLSYDNADEIRELYDNKELTVRMIDNMYSASPIGGNSFIGREILYSNLKNLPLSLNKKLCCKGLSIRIHESSPAQTSFKMESDYYDMNC